MGASSKWKDVRGGDGAEEGQKKGEYDSTPVNFTQIVTPV